MTGTSGSGESGAAGASARHVSVLARQSVEALAPREGGTYVDATFGAGGHTRLILAAAADCRVIAIDRDQSAVALGADLVSQARGRLVIFEDRFSQIANVLASAGVDKVDGVLADLGVSSMQIDEAERGFSFRHDGPLDMRMAGSGPSAADVIAAASDRDLAIIIARLGEERFARPIARAIVAHRADAPITTTRALVRIIETVLHQRPGEIHPATRTFQALRIFVNEELAEVANGLQAAERALAPGGRLAVISFHSLEDRIVKSYFTLRGRAAAVSRHQPVLDVAEPTLRIVTPKPIIADGDEVAANPRARSAKLRVAERTTAAWREPVFDPLPALPSLADVLKGR